MRHQFINIYSSRPFLIIFVLGVLLLLPSLLFENTLPHFWRTFFHVVGIAFIAVALTAPVSEFFQFKTLSQHMGIVRGALDSGIIHIFQSRVDDRESFQKAIESEFTQTSEICLLGIAFPEVFHHQPLPKPIDEKMFDPNILIKILVLNPDSQAAGKRSEIEIGRGTIYDIQRSIDSFQLFLKERAKLLGIDIKNDSIDGEVIKKIQMEIHQYDFSPIAFMIMTKRTLFLEQYHYGRLSYARPGECIGGRVPIFQYHSHALTFEIMQHHFDYVWTTDSKDITMQLLRNAQNAS